MSFSAFDIHIHVNYVESIFTLYRFCTKIKVLVRMLHDCCVVSTNIFVINGSWLVSSVVMLVKVSNDMILGT
jgi:hypothetical protein